MTKNPRNRRRSDAAPRNDPNFVTRADLARTRGCSRSAVTQACREGGPLHIAVRGTKIDLRHPATVAWLAPADATAKDLLRRKRLAECERLEIANAEKRGQLISREMVRTHVIGLIDSTHKLLLTDVPRKLGNTLPHLVRTGTSVPDLERMIRDEISKVLQREKAGVIERLRSSNEEQRRT